MGARGEVWDGNKFAETASRQCLTDACAGLGTLVFSFEMECVGRRVAHHLPKDTYINIMSQYRPMYKAFDYPRIVRKIRREEYDEAIRRAKELGLANLDVQGWSSWG